MLDKYFNLRAKCESIWWKSVFVLFLRATAVLALFCVDVVLGRLLGTSGFGVYSNAVATIMILTVVSLLGLENMMIREVAISGESGAVGYTNYIVRWGFKTAVRLSIIIALLFSGYILVLHPYDNPMMQTTMLIGLLLLPMLVVSNIVGIILRGFHKILIGQTIQHVVQPLVLVVGVGYFYFSCSGLSPAIAMAISTAGWFVAMVLAIVLLKQNLKPCSEENNKRLVTKSLWTTSLVFAVIAGVQMTNSRIDIMMTYWFVGESEAGIYSATVRICDLLVFAIIAINISIGPTLACLHHSGEINKLQAVATIAARVSTIAALPVILLVSLFSQFSMGLFGADFVGSPWPLIILCISQAVVVLTGSKTLLLVMSGEERKTAIVLGITAILHICVSIALIPSLGILGAAISTALSVICWSLWLTCVSIRTLKIDPTVFNVFSTPNMTNPKN